MSKSKKERIARLKESLSRFHPDCDLYAEIYRQLQLASSGTRRGRVEGPAVDRIENLRR